MLKLGCETVVMHLCNLDLSCNCSVEHCKLDDMAMDCWELSCLCQGTNVQKVEVKK